MGNVDDEEEDDFKVRKKRRRWILRDVKNNNTQQVKWNTCIPMGLRKRGRWKVY